MFMRHLKSINEYGRTVGFRYSEPSIKFNGLILEYTSSIQSYIPNIRRNLFNFTKIIFFLLSIFNLYNIVFSFKIFLLINFILLIH